MCSTGARFTSAIALVILLGWPAAARAQPAGQQSVREAAKTLLGGGFSDPEIDAVATILALQIATFPVGTSSGGFTFRFNDPTGAFVRRSPSFGPLFAERASTLGEEGRFTLGVSSQSTRFVSFEGHRLRNGALRSRIVFDGQSVDVDRFTFDVSTQTTSIAANVAVGETVDIGLIVPIVRTSLTGTASSLDFASLRRVERVVEAAGTGLGDIVLRGKWNFLDRQKSGLAGLLEVILPTGAEERLAGTGRVRIRPVFIASAEIGSFSPRVNLGYTFGGEGARIRPGGEFLPVIEGANAGDEFNYTLGGDVSPTQTVTVFADLVGRSLRDVARFDSGQRLIAMPGIGPIPIETFVARTGTLHTRLAAIGAKVTILQSGLLSFGLLFPLNEGGLRPGLTPVVGLEYTF
jgi:hypothetical protein